MKFIKYLKIMDLIFSIIFIGLFFYNYRITASYEYGLGQLIQIFFLLPVVVLLLVSAIMSVIALCNKKSKYLFSIIGQAIKIGTYLLNFVIIKYWLHIVFKVDYMVVIPIYSIVILLILLICKMINDSKKEVTYE